MINGINVRAYSQSHDLSVLYGVQQFLEVFKCCEELGAAIDIIVAEEAKIARLTAAKQKDRARDQLERAKADYLKQEMMTDEDDAFPGEPLPMPVVGMCPRCSEPMGGMYMHACEVKRSGRAFIKECTKCSYYSELFMRGPNVYEEIEGG